MKKGIIVGIVIFALMLGLCTHSPLLDKEDLNVFVTSDLHYFLEDYYKDCDWFEEEMLNGDGKMVTYKDIILDAFIKVCKKERPDAVIISGDLTFNGEKGSHEALAKVLGKIAQEGIIVATIPGNHDVDNIYAKGYGEEDYFKLESVDAQDFRTIYNDYGYRQAESKDSHSLSYRIDLNKNNSLLMLDTTAHELTGAAFDRGGLVSEDTMFWLENQLKYLKKRKINPIVVMHHNLAIHNTLLNSGYTINNQKTVGALLKKYDVKFVLSGHMHLQSIGQYDGIYDIASESLLNAPHQFGKLHISKGQMTYQTDTLEVGLNSKEYFMQCAKNRFKERVSLFDQADQEDVSNFIALTNYYYFSGTIYEHKEELQKMRGYQLVLTHKETKDFYSVYMEEILKVNAPQNQLTLTLNY